MSKSRDAFRTISEVAELLDTPAHVLRFWESKFTQVKPVKRAGGRRYYRPGDIGLLAGIRKLLHDDGMTIKGVQKILREQGVKHVATLAPLPLDDEDAPEAIESAPYIEAEPETGTVLPFAPLQPAEAVEPALAPETLSEPAPVPEAPVPAEAAVEPTETENDAWPAPADEADVPFDHAEAEIPEAPMMAAHEDSVPPVADHEAAPQEDHSAPVTDAPLTPEDDGADALPAFLTHSLEERTTETDTPLMAGEAQEDAPAPTWPEDTHDAPEATVQESTAGFAAEPQQSPEVPEDHAPEAPATEALGSTEGGQQDFVADEPPLTPETEVADEEEPALDTAEAAPLAEAPADAVPPAAEPVETDVESAPMVIPELPDLDNLPPSPPGLLTHLSRVETLSAAQARAIAPQVQALRDWLASKQDPARD